MDCLVSEKFPLKIYVICQLIKGQKNTVNTTDAS